MASEKHNGPVGDTCFGFKVSKRSNETVVLLPGIHRPSSKPWARGRESHN